jgi:hypothetical protein
MGRILIARCYNCHYQSETLYFGSGRCDDNEVCSYPALDTLDFKVITANIMEKEAEQLINPNLIFFDDDSLHMRKSDYDEVCYKWGDYKLFMDYNYCPHCQEYCLRFESTGLYC